MSEANRHGTIKPYLSYVQKVAGMASPFPGMDPFLEEPHDWSDVHGRFINAVSDQLADAVSPHFVVRFESRVYVAVADDVLLGQIIPDIYIVTKPAVETSRTAGTAATIVPPTLVEPLFEPEIRERYIEIRDAATREIVTTIEILSPTNKMRGAPGGKSFGQKRRSVLASGTHWIEIDLLREGERPDEIAGKSDYYALLHRTGHLAYDVWFFDLRDRMPTIAVPLRPPFEDVPLDLQAALDTTYARAHYDDSVDYAAPIPPPRLRPADEAWAVERVREWLGARRST